MNKKTKKTGVPLRAILLYICLCTFVVVGVTFSKYIASSGDGDSARVVKFDDISITETGDFVNGGENGGKLLLVPGTELEKKACVNFAGAETASYVFLEVSEGGFEYSAPRSFTAQGGKISLSIGDEWNVLDTSDGRHIYYIELEPNTPLNEFPIIKDNAVSVDWKLKNSELSNMDALSIAFKATAVQTDGRSAAAAWDMMK